MESTNAERGPQQRKDGTESSSKSSLLPLWPYLPSSTVDSSFVTLSCSWECKGVCEGCCYGEFLEKRRNSDGRISSYKRRGKKKIVSEEENTKSLKTNEAKTVEKSKLFNDYCPYSSDNCGCSSGCADCDYGLYTYTVKNKSKLKRVNTLYVRSSNGFRKTSERNRRPSITVNILKKKKKARFPKVENALESCYPDSSGSYDRKSDYMKRNFKLYITKDRIPKTKKRTLARNSRKLKTTRIVKPLKLLTISSKKVSKNAVSEVSERDFMKNWFPDSSNSCDCNSGCTDCGKLVTTKRKKLKNKSERTRASTNTRILELLRNIGTSSVIDESVKNKKESKQTAEIFGKRRLSWSSCDYSESDSYFTVEDCCNKYGNIRQSRRTKNA